MLYCMIKLFKICLKLFKIHLRYGNVFQRKLGRVTIIILILFCKNNFLVNDFFKIMKGMFYGFVPLFFMIFLAYEPSEATKSK